MTPLDDEPCFRDRAICCRLLLIYPCGSHTPVYTGVIQESAVEPCSKFGKFSSGHRTVKVSFHSNLHTNPGDRYQFSQHLKTQLTD